MTVVEKRTQSPEAARQSHAWLINSTDLYSNIIAHAGQYDSKVETKDNASLAAHILNAVTVAVNSFVYEAFSPGDDIEDYEEVIRVLAAATALHDTNKYVQEKHGVDTDGNTEAAFDIYFGEHGELDTDGDDFGIEDDFLGTGYRDDLLYLVQRCEIGEDSSESRRTETEFRGLERYCRIGDQVASIAQREGVHGVNRKLVEKFGEENVHLERFSAIEQPVLNNLLIGSVKQAITGEDGGDVAGVVIGSTTDSVVYLGEEMNRQALECRVSSILSKRDWTRALYCKLNWNSFNPSILEKVDIPAGEKEKIISNAFRELLHDGTAGVEAFEHIPDDFDEYFPILAKAIYLDKRSEFNDSDAQASYDRIYDEQGTQKSKIHFIAHLINNHVQYREFLDDLSEEIRPELHTDLEPESDALGTVVERFFNEGDLRLLGSKGEMCFLCGSKTDKPYEEGHKTVYQAQGFSRRLPPYRGKSSRGKSICNVCHLEYALVRHLCVQSGMNLDRRRPGSRTTGVSIAYMYFDDFLGDVRLREDRIGTELSETLDLSDRSVVTNLLQPQYYLQPFSFGDHPQMGEKNHRMVAVRQLMRAAQDSGMKVVIGNPIQRFESADSVFADEGATRPQELLGLNEVERFGPLPDSVDAEDVRTDSHLRRALALFDVMGKIGGIADITNQYLTLDRDSFHDIAHLSVSRAVGTGDKPSRPAYLPDEIYEYVKTYHAHQLMQMNTVAERGIDLFGKQFDSKYKKTKVFREALDAFLSGKNQNMPDEKLVKHVESQVYAAADREDYAGHVETEEAEAFVEAIRSYLVENDLYDLKKLSDWEDALVNSYYYAYDQLLYDDQ